jgi:thiamine biosynthesis lipoprotein
MGTLFRIVLYEDDGARALNAATAAFERIEELESRFSDYREDSELTLLCRESSASPRAVSPELFSVLEQSLRMSRLSGGAFDVTIGPVVQLWRKAGKEKKLPGPAALLKARQSVGYENLVLDPENGTVTLKVPEMRLDLGGIGKGFAADRALELISSRGIERAMVVAGGEIRVGAPPPGQAGWKVAIGNPDPATPEQMYLVIRDAAVATSGDTFRFVEAGGRRYSHIVDPRSGIGLTDSAYVTVVAPDGTTADALATALNVMPTAAGIRLVQSIPRASAAIMRRGSNGMERVYSAGFPARATPQASARRQKQP